VIENFSLKTYFLFKIILFKVYLNIKSKFMITEKLQAGSVSVITLYILQEEKVDWQALQPLKEQMWILTKQWLPHLPMSDTE
jgi:hypothetical protein